MRKGYNENRGGGIQNVVRSKKIPANILHSTGNILCFYKMIVGMKNDANKMRTVILQELVSEMKNATFYESENENRDFAFVNINRSKAYHLHSSFHWKHLMLL